MAKFKNKKGGICEVYTLDNIKKLTNDKNYTRIDEKNADIKSKTLVVVNSPSDEESSSNKVK